MMNRALRPVYSTSRIDDAPNQVGVENQNLVPNAMAIENVPAEIPNDSQEPVASTSANSRRHIKLDELNNAVDAAQSSVARANIQSNSQVTPAQSIPRRVRFSSIDSVQQELNLSPARSSGPARRMNRSKSVDSRRVHLHQDPEPLNDIPLRRSNRNRKPTDIFNFHDVKCCICKRTFRQPIPTGYFCDGIVCSFDCIRKRR